MGFIFWVRERNIIGGTTFLMIFILYYAILDFILEVEFQVRTILFRLISSVSFFIKFKRIMFLADYDNSFLSDRRDFV